MVKRHPSARGLLTLHVGNVTGSREAVVEVPRSLPAESAARAIAAAFDLDSEVPWTLRQDSSSAFLDERPMGEQLESGARLTLSPRTHLGGRANRS